MPQESASFGEMCEAAEEGELAGVVQRAQSGEEQAAEQGTKDADREQEGGARRYPACSIAGDAAARHDHMDMRMMGERRAPGVEDGGDADPGAEVLRVGGDGQHRIGRGLEQEVIDERLVVIGDRGDLGRQGEHDMEIADREQISLAGLEPAARRDALALRAVAVAAAVIGDPPVPAVGTGFDVPAERGGAAMFDRRHDLELVQAQMPGMGSAIGRSSIAEDVGNLE